MAKSRHSTKKVNKKSRKYVCRQRKRTGGTLRKAVANDMGKNPLTPAQAHYAARDADPNAIRAKKQNHCCCQLWETLFGGPEGATPMKLEDLPNGQLI